MDDIYLRVLFTGMIIYFLKSVKENLTQNKITLKIRLKEKGR